MARAKQRIYPLHQETTRSMRNAIRLELHGFNTLRQLGYDATCALCHTAGLRDTSNIIEYIREACWFEVHYPWRARQSFGEPCNSAITDGADVAQFLGENYIRLQLTQERLVDCVNCAVITQLPPNPLIDFATRQPSIVHWTMRDPWPRACFFWKITLMRNTDYLIHQTKRGRNLGRSGQKRNNAKHFSFYALSPHQNRKGAHSPRACSDYFNNLQLSGSAMPYKTPTARAINRTTIVSEIKIWVIAKTFAQRASTGASVGPKVELCVKATNR
jgi:hypothetical protein